MRTKEDLIQELNEMANNNATAKETRKWFFALLPEEQEIVREWMDEVAAKINSICERLLGVKKK